MSASDSHDGKSSSHTLARKDWCKAGLAALTADGEKGLTISRLAERLGVTYGSFYHHFENSEEFHAAVLKHWFQELLVPLARRNLAASRPSMEAVVRDVESSGYSPVEIAVRRWARDYAPAATAVRRADRYRMRVMGQMLQKRGVPPAEARATTRSSTVGVPRASTSGVNSVPGVRYPIIVLVPRVHRRPMLTVLKAVLPSLGLA